MSSKILLIYKIFLIKIITSTAVDHPYCFRLTWLGAYQDKSNILGLTCEHLREDLTYIPCRKPLVATHNDEPPNMTDLWLSNRNQNLNLFGCPMTPGEACVKYTYIYNNAIQNITYMCAKVNASDGCYYQKYITGLEVEVCVCTSIYGMMPCNIGNRIWPQPNRTLWLTIFIIIILIAFEKEINF